MLPYFRLGLLLGLLLPAGLLAHPAPDTVRVGPQQLQLQYLKPGHLNYLGYFRKTPDSPSVGLTLVDITIEKQTYEKQPAFVVQQRWDADGKLAHTARTVFAARDFAMLRHDTYWLRTGYAANFDFTTRQVTYEPNGVPPDSVQRAYQQELAHAAEQATLNWHSDLIVFSLLPYQEKRTFRINFYDPGFGPPTETLYTVVGSENLPGSGGAPVPCWILEYKYEWKQKPVVQRFWIAKKTREVLREDQKLSAGHGYKLKTAATQ